MAKTAKQSSKLTAAGYPACQRCNKAPATVHVTTILKGKLREQHLCEKCVEPQLRPVRFTGPKVEKVLPLPFSVSRHVSVPALIVKTAKGPTARRAAELVCQAATNKFRMVTSSDFNAVGRIADALVRTLRRGRRIYIMGNGGSAADSQHFAAELVGRFKMERRGLPAVAFSTDTSCLTAIGNDYGFDNVFARQVEALVRKGDAVIGISTSGNSPNVVKAIQKANRIGATSIGLSGEQGGQLAKACTFCYKAPGATSDRIQECHITVIHALCQIIEEKLFGRSKTAGIK